MIQINPFRFVLAGLLGAALGWIISEPWTESFGYWRDFFIFFCVSTGIIFALVSEKYIVNKKFEYFKSLPRKLPYLLIPLFAILLVKQIFTQEAVVDYGVDTQRDSRVLVLDVSSSMGGSAIQELKVAVNEYLNIMEHTQSQDQIACVTFNDNAALLFGMNNNYASMKTRVSRLETSGGTALYDAINMAEQELISSDLGGKEIILVSDGLPQDGDQVINHIRNAKNIQIYTVGVGSGYDQDFLEDIANYSNGRFFPADDISSLTGIFKEIAAGGLTQGSSSDQIPLPLWKRVIGWMLLSFVIGITVAFVDEREGLLVIGGTGGLVGGLISALLFHVIGSMGIGDSASISRMISFMLLGAILGISIFFMSKLLGKANHGSDFSKFRNKK